MRVFRVFSGSLAPHKKTQIHSQLTWHSFYFWFKLQLIHMRGKGAMASMGDDSQPFLSARYSTVQQQEALGHFSEVVISEVSQSNAAGYFGSLASWSAWLPCCLFPQLRWILNWGRCEICNICGTFNYSLSGWSRHKDTTGSSWSCFAEDALVTWESSECLPTKHCHNKTVLQNDDPLLFVNSNYSNYYPQQQEDRLDTRRERLTSRTKFVQISKVYKKT